MADNWMMKLVKQTVTDDLVDAFEEIIISDYKDNPEADLEGLLNDLLIDFWAYCDERMREKMRKTGRIDSNLI